MMKKALGHASPSPAGPLSTTITTSSSQLNAPFTKARKRTRGEDAEMEDAALLPDRKRRLLNTSQNASPSTIWSRGGSAAKALRLDLGRIQQDGDMDEVLGPSPLRNDSGYRLIFDDPPVFALGKEGMSSRTNPLPPECCYLAKRNVSPPPSKWRDSMDSSRGPHLLESASDLAVGPGPRLRSKTGGLQV